MVNDICNQVLQSSDSIYFYLKHNNVYIYIFFFSLKLILECLLRILELYRGETHSLVLLTGMCCFFFFSNVINIGFFGGGSVSTFAFQLLVLGLNSNWDTACKDLVHSPCVIITHYTGLIC